MNHIKRSLSILLGTFLVGVGVGWSWSDPQRQTATTDPRDGIDEDADSPGELSKTGWKIALLRTKQALKDKQLSTQASGLAYHTTLVFFPALLGVATVFATFAGTHRLLSVITGLQGVVPPAIYDLIHQQLSPLVTAHRSSLGAAAIISVIALLWTTSGGLQNLIKTTNVAYEVIETRELIKRRLLCVVLSIVLLILGGAILLLLLLQTTALAKLGAPHIIATVFPWVRWPILIVLLAVTLSVIYRYAPDRKAPHWSWVSWGATAATLIWLLGTFLFFLYAQKFGNFNKTYGIFAGIIVLMTWFNLSSLIILIGAQVNKKLEEVTDADTQTD